MTTTLTFDETMMGYMARGEGLSPDVGYEQGRQSGISFGCQISIRIDDLDRFIAEPKHQASVTGRIRGTLFPEEPKITSGTFNLMTEGPGRRRLMEYSLDFESGGTRYRVVGQKHIEDDPLAWDAAEDLTTLFTHVETVAGKKIAAGIIRFRLSELGDLAGSVRVSGTDQPGLAKARFLNFFLSKELGVLTAGWKDFEVGAKRRALARAHAEMRPRYDVVIVGSGYGGGVLASRLSAWTKDGKGKSICVLERGKDWRAGDFPDQPFEMPDALRHPGNPLGLFDFQLHDDIDVLVGSGLGGTSLINANVMIRPELDTFKRPGWPAGLPKDLTPYLERAERALEVRPHPQAPLKSKVFAKAAEKAGQLSELRLLNLAVTFEDCHRDAGDVVQKACIDCGGCVTGCNHTAKNSVDMNYLAEAERRGAHIFACVEVRTVEKLSEGIYRVHAIDHEQPGKSITIDASQVVLSAGSIGSFEILARSRRAHGLELSARLGAAFNGNGDVIGLGYNTDEKTEIGKGPTITTVAKYWQDPELDKHFMIEEGAIPSALRAVIRGALPLVRSLGKDTDEGFWDGVKEWLREGADTVGAASRGALNHSLLYLGMGFEDELGALAFDPDRDRAKVDWPGVAGQSFAERIDDKMLAITAAVGGRYVKNPRAREFLGRNLVTVHPLGGCPMGDNPDTGAVDCEGAVFGHEGHLFVADGSILPAPVGVNPALTIAALSEWIAERLLSRWS